MDTDLIQQPDLELVALNFGKRLWEWWDESVVAYAQITSRNFAERAK
jgi:hypothetical protein